MPEPEPEPVAEPAVSVSTSRPVDQAFQALFTVRTTDDLMDKLQTQSIRNIQSAMGINERLLTINELFGGDAGAFEETVSHLNGLTDFESAKQYLIEGVARNYQWTKDDKVDKASTFIQIIRRKYL